MKVELVVETAALVGECPLWCPRDATLYWLDLSGAVLHGYVPSTEAAWQQDVAGGLASLGGLVRSRTPGSVVLAHDRGVVQYDRHTGRERLVVHPLSDAKGVRYNDMKVDPVGRLWISTADIDETMPHGALIVVDGSEWRTCIEGLVVSNGPAFSADGRTAYLSDSTRRRILSLSLDDRGRLTEKRVFAELGDAGLPDGLTVDTEGGLWVALWEGAALHRYTADGVLDAVVEVPALNVTSVAFGGSDLDRLFVTTARDGLDAEALERYPGSGGLFVTSPGVKGLLEPVVAESFA